MAPELTVFSDPRSLLLALHHALPQPEPLPQAVVQTASGFAVARTVLGEGFDALARQHGWSIALRRRRQSDRETPLVRLLGGVDWQPMRASHQAVSPAESSIQLHRGDPRIRYLLAADTEKHARRLLDTLTRFLVPGIRAVPLTVDSDADLAFFWYVEAGCQPPMPVLRAAARVYWGPVTRDDLLWIFKQWPLDLALPDALLRRLPWNERNGMVLLARDAPEVCRLRPGAAGRSWTELAQVATLRIGSYATARVSTEPNETTFRVDLRMVPASVAGRLDRRIHELEREIGAKRQVLDALRAQRDRSPGASPGVRQPLFLYREPTGRTVPLPLRRLLIDWSGSAEEIAALRYAKIDGGSLPERHRRSGEQIHVLTTAAAVAAPSAEPMPATVPAIGWRFEDYAPRRNANTRFERDERWAAFGLALFLPGGQDLGLYPEVAPSAFNAQRLAGALLGDATRVAHELALLFADTEGAVTVWRIPRRTFRPLTDARGWQCAIDVESMAPSVASRLADDVRTAFVGSLDQALSEAVHEERERRLSPIHQTLQQTLDTEARRVEQRHRQLADLRAGLDAFDQAIGTSLEHLEATVKVLHDETKPLDDLLARQHTELVQLEAAATRLRTAERTLRSLVAEARTLHRPRARRPSQRRGVRA